MRTIYRDFYITPIFQAAGLEGKTPHQFRHTFASRLLVNKVSVENVAALLGNSPEIVWENYGTWVEARKLLVGTI